MADSRSVNPTPKTWIEVNKEELNLILKGLALREASGLQAKENRELRSGLWLVYQDMEG